MYETTSYEIVQLMINCSALRHQHKNASEKSAQPELHERLPH